jgi:purine nucleosidase
MALRKAPDIIEKITRITVMGGAQLGFAGFTEVAEFNIYADPEAAKIVFDSGIPITMVPLEVCLSGDGSADAQTILNETEITELRALGTKRAEFAVDCNRSLIEFCTKLTGQRSLILPDPTAITVALRPQEILRQYTANITVDLSGELTYGQTVVNVRGGTALDGQAIKHNTTIVSAISGKGFKAHLNAALK